MANVHKVVIEGRLPYDIVNNMNINCLRMFARLLIPSWGLRIEFGQESYEPVPETGGKLTYYNFKITGSEAIWESSIVQFCKDLKGAGAKIARADVMDMEFDDMPTGGSILKEI